MHPTPSRRSRLSRSLASCAAIAILASGIGLTTGAAAHAQLPRSGPAAHLVEGPIADPADAADAVSEPTSEEQETPETPEPGETVPPTPGAGDDTSVVPAAPETPGEPDPSAVTPPAEESVETPAPAPEPSAETPPTSSAPSIRTQEPSGPVTHSAGSIPEVEPNGSTARAQDLPLGTQVNAKFGPSADCDNFSDCDVFRINAPSAGRLTLDLRFASTLGTNAALLVTVTNAAGTVTHKAELSSADYSGAKLRNTFLSVSAGVSYITVKARVESFGATPVWRNQPYTLVAQVAPALVELEPNSSTSRATPLPLGRTLTGATLTPDCANNFYDCDFYRVTVPSRTSMTVDFRASCKIGTARPYEVAVLDNAGSTVRSIKLGGPDCAGAPFAVTLPAGNAYIMVAAHADSRGKAISGVPYTLTASMKVTASTPTISGGTSVGSTLTAKPGKWGPGTMKFAYQWKRDGTAIAQATGTTYRLTKSDVGRNITVTVTGSRAGVGSASRTSAKKFIPTTFIDVGRGHKFYAEIQWMYDTKRTTGIRTAKGLAYQPKSGVTREAMAAFLFRQEAKKGYTPPKKSPFRDVPTSHKFYTEIAWMYEQGISTGSKTSAGRAYRPKSGVSREAMAAFLFRLRAPESTPAPKAAPFADVGTGHKFAREIAWMKSSKLSTGSKIGGRIVYQPGTTVSREAMAAFLYRMDRSVPPKPTTPTTPKPPTTKALSAAVPSISGNGRPGHTLTAHTGTWGPAPVSLSFQWLLNGTPIAGATGQHFTVRLGDGRQNISVKVTGSKRGYTTANRTSGTVWVAPDLGDRLVAGQTLPNNYYLQSNNGRHRLVMQTDGNLVMYKDGAAVWSSQTTGAGSGATVTMQGDGNLVIYAGGTARWSSKTLGKTGAYLVVQDDSNLVIYAGGRAVWDRVTKG